MEVENQENEVIEQTEAEEVEASSQEAEVKSEDGEPKEAPTVEIEDDNIVVTIGEETPPQEEHTEAPEWVKELRATNRELKKKNRELESKVNVPAETVALGEKPTLESSDYDEAVYETNLTKWYENKREIDLSENKKQEDVQAQAKAWGETLAGYGEAKNNLKVKDFDEAEETVLENLSETQQGMILQGADNSALVVYALGKNPKLAKELASIKDPVKFAFAVAKMETTLKVTNRKAPPPPEKTVTGSGNSAGAVDSTLEKLREDASKSGDYSKVVAYKKNKKG